VTPVGAQSKAVAFDTYYPYPVFNPNVINSGPGEYGFITGDPDQAFPDAQDLEYPNQADSALTSRRSSWPAISSPRATEAIHFRRRRAPAAALESR